MSVGFKTDRPEPQKTASALFTIGRSSMEAGEFTRLLAMHEAGVVMDVRSRPASGRFPHFNGAVLKNILPSEGIAYQFLGEELGGRPADPAA